MSKNYINRIILDSFEKINQEAWKKLLLSSSSATVFQTPEMYEVYARTKGYQPYVIAQIEGDELIAIVVIVVMQEEGLKKYFSRRAIVYGTPVCKDGQEDAVADLMKAWTKIAEKEGVIYTEVRPVYNANGWRSVFESVGYEYEGHYSIILSLDKTEDELYNGMHKERRRNVRHAEKEGLRFEESDYNENGIALLQRTYNRVKMPIADASMFRSAANHLGDKVKFFAVYDGEKMIAYQIRLCYKEMVYAWYAGSDEREFKKRPNDFLQWKVICWARNNGYRHFDFGGGGRPNVPYGVRDYKLKYGADIFEFGRYKKIHNMLRYKIGVLGMSLLKTMKK